jgi:phosphohistidine phosphatase
MDVRFDAILYSPKVRAAQTAELAAEAWDEDERGRMESYQPLAGGLEAGEALDVLAGMGPDGRALLVGHEPDLSLLAAALTGARVDLKKGGLAVLRLDGASAELAVLMRPRDLALVAGLPVGGQ